MRREAYRAVSIFHWIAVFITAILGAVTRVNLAWFSGQLAPFSPVIIWLQTKIWVLFFSSIFVVLCSFALKKIGAPWVRDAIKHVLDEMREHAFRGMTQQPDHHYRVTLFRRTNFCWRALRDSKWPFGGYLVPFARSGHVTQKVSVYFSVPDNADCAEGVAGVAFVGGARVDRQDLPDVNRDNPLERDLKSYASETFVTVDWLRKERSTARSLIGFPVRVKGRPWGVIVVDSRFERIQGKDTIIKSYELVAAVLGELLERS